MKMKNNDSDLIAEAYSNILSNSSKKKKEVLKESKRVKAKSTLVKEGASLLGKVLEIIAEAKKKAVSNKTNVNPWAVEKSVEKKTGHKFSPKKKEKIVKGIKKSAKKAGKKITSKPIKKSK